jgi:hypothetical protein
MFEARSTDEVRNVIEMAERKPETVKVTGVEAER